MACPKVQTHDAREGCVVTRLFTRRHAAGHGIREQPGVWDVNAAPGSGFGGAPEGPGPQWRLKKTKWARLGSNQRPLACEGETGVRAWLVWLYSAVLRGV